MPNRLQKGQTKSCFRRAISLWFSKHLCFHRTVYMTIYSISFQKHSWGVFSNKRHMKKWLCVLLQIKQNLKDYKWKIEFSYRWIRIQTQNLKNMHGWGVSLSFFSLFFIPKKREILRIYKFWGAFSSLGRFIMFKMLPFHYIFSINVQLKRFLFSEKRSSTSTVGYL